MSAAATGSLNPANVTNPRAQVARADAEEGIVTDPDEYALAPQHRDALRDELRAMVRGWARSLADTDHDTPLHRSELDTRNHVELARIAVARLVGDELDDIEQSAAYFAAAQGSSYSDLAVAGRLSDRHAARDRYARAGRAMRSRSWVQRNRAAWVVALRELLAMRSRISATAAGTELVAELDAMLPDADVDISDALLVHALDRVDRFTCEASTEDGEARRAVDRARTVLAAWKAESSGEAVDGDDEPDPS